jgi:hypothetical protein
VVKVVIRVSNKIFSGKGAKYNTLILKALFEKGCLSAYNIAKEIAANDPKAKTKEYFHHKAQKINSVLVRKNGRLPQLEKQEFIKRTENGYNLTIFKGLCSALALFDKVKKPGFDDFFDSYKLLPELKAIIEIASRTNPEAIIEDYRILRKITMEYLEKGINFELISNAEFNLLVNERYQKLVLDELKTEKRGRESWKENPELQDAVMKLADRFYNLALKEMKEYAALKEKIIDKSTKEKNQNE